MPEFAPPAYSDAALAPHAKPAALEGRHVPSPASPSSTMRTRDFRKGHRAGRDRGHFDALQGLTATQETGLRHANFSQRKSDLTGP